MHSQYGAGAGAGGGGVPGGGGQYMQKGMPLQSVSEEPAAAVLARAGLQPAGPTYSHQRLHEPHFVLCFNPFTPSLPLKSAHNSVLALSRVNTGVKVGVYRVLYGQTLSEAPLKSSE